MYMVCAALDSQIWHTCRLTYIKHGYHSLVLSMPIHKHVSCSPIITLLAPHINLAYIVSQARKGLNTS